MAYYFNFLESLRKTRGILTVGKSSWRQKHTNNELVVGSLYCPKEGRAFHVVVNSRKEKYLRVWLSSVSDLLNQFSEPFLVTSYDHKTSMFTVLFMSELVRISNDDLAFRHGVEKV